MSTRIQNILEKAARDGGMQRTFIEPATAVSPVFENARDLAITPAAPPEIVEPATGGRVFSEARLSPRLRAAASNPVTAEQYRTLRTRIVHADHGFPVHVVLVTSPGRGDGRSFTSSNLGLTMAQEYQRRICVVDADLSHPEQHQLFGLPDGPGLAEVLGGRATLDDALVTLPEHHLTVLPAGSGTAHPAELLGTTTMRRTVETLRSRFDCVVVDGPGVARLAEVGVLTPLVDRVVMVVRDGVTPKPAIHDAIAALGGKLLGIVLNDAT